MLWPRWGMAMNWPSWIPIFLLHPWRDGWCGWMAQDLPSVLEACLRLFPLDTFVKDPAIRMMQVHAPDEIPEVQPGLPKNH